MSFAIIKAHPKSSDVALVDMPSDIAKTLQEQIDAPRIFWNRERRSWYLQTENVEVLTRILRRLGAHVTDERAPDAPVSTGPIRHRPLPECRHCQAPYRRGSTQAYCHSCGRPTDIIEITADDITGGHPTRDCDRCHRTQTGAFDWCGHCGAPMPPAQPATRPPVVLPPRPQLTDPLPLAETLAQLDLQHPNPQLQG